ncbi:MAG: SLC13 family permease [Acidobacteriota bacterium]
MEIAIVLGLLLIAVIMFAMERLSVDVITLLLLMGLVTTGILTPLEAFAGFSNDIIIILASIFVISGALQQSGIMDILAARLYQFARGGRNRLLLAMMVIIGSISSFMNNTTATAIFIPPVMGVAKTANLSPSKLLMPLAFASILGGTCTLIGTSTNVAVSGFISRSGMPALRLFEITPIGLMLLGVGIIYLLFIGQRLLPEYREESLTEEYDIREYLSEIVIPRGSMLIGQKIFHSSLSQIGFRILEVLRGDTRFIPDASTIIQSGDVLLVEGRISDLMKVKETADIEIRPEVKLFDDSLQTGEIRMAEVIVTPQSDLIGKTLKEVNFRLRYGMVVLAFNRHGRLVTEKVGNIRLRMGDLLLIQGSTDQLEYVRRHPDMWILEEIRPSVNRAKKGGYIVACLAIAVIVGGLGWLPLSIVFLGAALLTILLKTITIEEAYEYINWKLIILIGGMMAFGMAMEKTGAAEFLAKGIVEGLEPFGIRVVLAGLFLLTILLTQPMSNAAAALVVLPIAMQTAQKLGANQRSFAIAIMLAASISFIAPFEPACILVYGPGKYQFRDFIKTGALLTFILMLVVLFILPVFWPLFPR